MRAFLSLVAIALSGCATVPPTSPQDAFFESLKGNCGRVLAGRLVSSDQQDRDMTGKPLVANFVGCSNSEVRINFAVGADKSRNWVVTRTPGGLRLKHVHLHDDGTEDELSQYGGDTVSSGTASRQEFPADAFSKDLFTRRNIAQSTTNVWAMEAGTPNAFAYELRRPGRYFRVEFDRAPVR
jgi:hypothetical protein